MPCSSVGEEGVDLSKIRDMGYYWVETPVDYRLLTCSLERAGASWTEIRAQLVKEANQMAFGCGPSAREAWIAEVTALQRVREAAVSDGESNDIYNRHFRRQYPLINDSISGPGHMFRLG
jgi:hypothetical protein